jgi:hypothetical protein
MKKKIERISKSLRWLKNDLRNEAIKEKDETLEKKLWRWHYRAKDAEYEVDILTEQSDVRDVLKRAIEKGLFDDEDLSNLNLEDHDEDEDEEAPPPKPKKKKPKSKKKSPSDESAEDDKLPKQKGLWD